MSRRPYYRKVSEWRGPTWLTRRYYKALGYHVAYVENYFERSQIKLDAWGFADFLCFRADRPGMVAVNACQEHEINYHVAKFRLLTTAWDFLRACSDNRLVIAGWAKPEIYGGEPTVRFKQMRLGHFEYRDGECCTWRPKLKRAKAAAMSSSPSRASTKSASTAPGMATSIRGSSKTAAKIATSKQDMTLWTAAAS